MKTIPLVFVLVIFLIGADGTVVAAEGTSRSGHVSIENTFDYGTLIEYVIAIPDSGHDLSMVFSRRRKSEGSEEIAHSYLIYRFKPTEEKKVISVDEQRSFLTITMDALHSRFGSDLKLTSLSSHEYMGVKETERKGILAFRNFSDWRKYLKNNSIYTQWEIYSIVLQRWRKKGVFSEFIQTFKMLGYACEISGFEKLFIYKAEERPLYSEWKKLGIKPEDRFPYPGMVHFELNRIE